MTGIPVDRLDFLVRMWEESCWFPPFYADMTMEQKRERVLEWLEGKYPIIRARKNV